MKLDEIYLNDILIWNLELSEQVEYINLLVNEKKRFKNIIFNLYINDYSNQMLEKSIDINNEKIENAFSYRKVYMKMKRKFLKL